MSEQIFIQIDNEVIELTGQALDDFLAQREKDNAEQELIKQQQLELQQLKESGIAKLKSLGLSDDEVKALLGQ